jgi:hypothetical protein
MRYSSPEQNPSLATSTFLARVGETMSQTSIIVATVDFGSAVLRYGDNVLQGIAKEPISLGIIIACGSVLIGGEYLKYLHKNKVQKLYPNIDRDSIEIPNLLPKRMRDALTSHTPSLLHRRSKLFK